MTDVRMWQHFTWRGHHVVVIQQWTDPFGRPMLRFADPDDEAMAAGMSVEQFVAEATPSAGPSPVEPDDQQH